MMAEGCCQQTWDKDLDIMQWEHLIRLQVSNLILPEEQDGHLICEGNSEKIKLCKGREKSSSHNNPVTRDCFHLFCCVFKAVGGEYEGRI